MASALEVETLSKKYGRFNPPIQERKRALNRRRRERECANPLRTTIPPSNPNIVTFHETSTDAANTGPVQVNYIYNEEAEYNPFGIEAGPTGTILYEDPPNLFEPDSITNANACCSMYNNLYKDTTRYWNGIWCLLFRWRGSVYQLVWRPLLIFLFVYSILSLIYRLILIKHESTKQTFELLCVYCDRFASVIPVTLIVGFYVSQVSGRWWDQFMAIPWPEGFAMKLVSFCPGSDPFNRRLRNTVMRYINVSMILVFRLTSIRVRRKYPNYQSLVTGNMLLPHERQRLIDLDCKLPGESSFAPIFWALKLLAKARSDGKLEFEKFENLVDGLIEILRAERKMMNYSWINFPLAYTQIATLGVISHFVGSLFARQFLLPGDQVSETSYDPFPNSTIVYTDVPPFTEHNPDIVIPFYTIIQFVCYMGWVKVAEALQNPFGDDDEDFPILYIIRRNERLTQLIVGSHNAELDSVDIYREAGITSSKRRTSELPDEPKAKKQQGRFQITAASGRFDVSAVTATEKDLADHRNLEETQKQFIAGEQFEKTASAPGLFEVPVGSDEDAFNEQGRKTSIKSECETPGTPFEQISRPESVTDDTQHLLKEQ